MDYNNYEQVLEFYHFHRQEKENFADIGVQDFDDFFFITEEICKNYNFTPLGMTKFKKMLLESGKIKKKEVEWIDAYCNKLKKK